MAGENIAEAWISMPDSICPFLTAQQRMQMMLYAQNGDFSPVKNEFEGESRIDSINVINDYLSIQVTDNMHWVITTAAGMIRIEKVISAPMPNTTFLYYDFTWKLLRREHEPFTVEHTDEDKIQYF